MPRYYKKHRKLTTGRYKYEPPQAREALSADIARFYSQLELAREAMRNYIEETSEALTLWEEKRAEWVKNLTEEKREEWVKNREEWEKCEHETVLFGNIGTFDSDALADLEKTRSCLTSKIWTAKEEVACLIRRDVAKRGFWKGLFSDELSPQTTMRIAELVALQKRYEEQLEKLPPPDGPIKCPLDEAVLKKLKRRETTVLRLIQSAESALRKCENEERTAAAAAAHFGKTRDRAVEIKGGLDQQFDITKDCPYCGLPLGDAAHADHIYPVSKGGLSTHANMIIICMQCNLRKGDMTLREFMKKYKLDSERIESLLERLGKRF